MVWLAFPLGCTIVMVVVFPIWLAGKRKGVVVVVIGAGGSCHPNACMHECAVGALAESASGGHCGG